MDIVRPRVLAVDGDILAYRTAAVCETHFEGACDSILDSTLRDIATDTNVPNVRIYVSGERNFRYDVAKTKPYKGNRATMVRPQYLDHCKAYLKEAYGAVAVDGYEADDAIATDMHVNGAAHCGIDKDMFQCAGLHYNYVKKEWVRVTDDEAILNLYRQVLMGDTSDNVPGLPRIGEKKAHDAIQDPETALDDAMSFYEAVCAKSLPGVNHIEYMAEQLQLIRMVCDVPLHCIDFDTYTVLTQDSQGFVEQAGEAVDSPIVPRVRGL